MADHDQRFKSLLKAFFAEFFQVFFPAWADRFDFSARRLAGAGGLHRPAPG